MVELASLLQVINWFVDNITDVAIVESMTLDSRSKSIYGMQSVIQNQSIDTGNRKINNVKHFICNLINSIHQVHFVNINHFQARLE